MSDLPYLPTCPAALPPGVPGLACVALATPSLAPTAGRLAPRGAAHRRNNRRNNS
ncbi:hypothetical protein C8N33_109229 [Pararhodobacter aggregans]|nr:hypothetical protein C8N33_109229 [Pararhodobacter aggregans]